MPWLDFAAYPIWLNLAIVVAAAAVVWFAGSRLSAYADVIAERTGLGQAFIGVLLLAGATSLPELGTTVTAAVGGNAPLAVNNLFGGIVLQTAILALADAVVGRDALTYFTPRPVLLLQGTTLVLLLALALAGVAAGEVVSLFGVGFWPALIAAAYLLSLILLRRAEGREGWRPVDPPPERDHEGEAHASAELPSAAWSPGRLALAFAAGAGAILVAGVVVTGAVEAVAGQSGLGASFVGQTLLAGATSLPEVSTTLAAARRGSYTLAVSNILGSNAFCLFLLVVADVAYRPGPILAAADRAATFGATIGIAVTAIYLIGLIERRDRVVLRMGLDSLAVLVVYLGSVVVLYSLR